MTCRPLLKPGGRGTTAGAPPRGVHARMRAPMLVAYATAHGFGHMTRLCEVLAAVRRRAPSLPITFVGTLPEALVRRAVPGPIDVRLVATDAGLVQLDALEMDLAASAVPSSTRRGRRARRPRRASCATPARGSSSPTSPPSRSTPRPGPACPP